MKKYYWQEKNMGSETILIIFYFFILLYSIIIHEVAHGLAASFLDDKTAKYAGRLTLNPINHIDFMGSIIVPIIMYYSFGFAFGWAKPVPYNPYNLKNQKWGPAIVALAGPLSNIIVAFLATILAMIINIPVTLKKDIIFSFNNWSEIAPAISGSMGAIFFEFLSIVIIINSFLAFFNLIPIPPLDGSKIAFTILSVREEIVAVLEQYGFFILLLFMLLTPLRAFLAYGFYFLLNIFLKLII